MKKIMIIGMTGSGKSTLAEILSNKFKIPVYGLDKIFWKEEGGLKEETFIAYQKEIIAYPEWIMDGSFPRSSSIDLRMDNADTIIFYDLPILMVFARRFKRYIDANKPGAPSGLSHEKLWPFTWKEIKYAMAYPTKEIYSKINARKNTKRVIIIKNRKQEELFILKSSILQV